MIACLRLGIIYTNLDPENPRERLEKILDVCRPRLIVNSIKNLIHSDFLGNLYEIIEISHLTQEVAEADYKKLPPLEAVTGSSPSYIMFTSGSTGIPKGAVISHSNLLSFIQWSKKRFAIKATDILTNVNPMYFDNSVFDFYTAIFSGAALVPFKQHQVQDPRSLVQLVSDCDCTIWFSVPSLLVYLLTTRAISNKSMIKIRKIIFGGEGFPKTKLKELYDILSGKVELINVYGPTECTCICSAHTVTKDDFENMQDLTMLGHLSENFESIILPQDSKDTNIGELVLFGTQIGLGYFNEKERSKNHLFKIPYTCFIVISVTVLEISYIVMLQVNCTLKVV